MRKASITALALLFAVVGTLAAQERFRKSPPVPDPLPELQLPKIESTRLSNGLTVAVAYQKNLPYISIELVILAGESDSPEKLPGLAGFTAELVSRGTALVSADQVEERVERIGGQFSVSTTLDYSRFSFLFLDEYLDEALQTLSLIILRPALADREVDNLKRIRFYDMWQEQREPEFVGRRQLLRVLFKDHPYAKGQFSLEGMKSFNKSLNRKDALGFYQQYYRPNNAFLVLAGNLNLSAASRKVSQYFSTWEPKDVNRPPLPSPEQNGGEKVCFVDFPRAKDASLVVGNILFAFDDPDIFPYLVLNQVLGGTPNSRLFMNLRESKEFAYFAFSEMELFRGSGVYEVRARVVPSACQAAVREILRELDRAAREKMTTFEIEQAKSYLIGNFPMQLNRLDSLARRVSEIVTFSLGDSHWSQFYDSISLVDIDRVFEVGQKYLLSQPVVVIVGDRATMVEYLREFPKVEVYDTNGVLLYTMLKGVEE